MDVADVHGPIDYLVIQYPSGAATAAPAAALAELLDRGTVLLYDLVVVARSEDGGGVEVGASAFDAFGGARSGLVDDDDVRLAAAALDPGTTGVVVVYENAWARSFVAATRAVGGELVASARLTAQDLMDSLDALEATDPVG